MDYFGAKMWVEDLGALHSRKSISNVHTGYVETSRRYAGRGNISIFKLQREKQAGRQGCFVKRLATGMVLSLCHWNNSVISPRAGSSGATIHACDMGRGRGDAGSGRGETPRHAKLASSRKEDWLCYTAISRVPKVEQRGGKTGFVEIGQTPCVSGCDWRSKCDNFGRKR